MGEDDEPNLSRENPSRAQRAKLISAVSLAVVAIAGIAYLRPPAAPPAPSSAVASRSTSTSFQLDAVDFVSQSTGWVLEDLDDFQFAVLGTTDGGRHWNPELLEPTVLNGEYMRFFDAGHGVVATVGGEPQLYTTDDGGRHWARRVVLNLSTFGISASFTDARHGWELLVDGPEMPVISPDLVRTVDGGRTWTRLGLDLKGGAQPLAVSFTDSQHGWLDTVSPTPVAYGTDDGGVTWHSVLLPAPPGGWPVPQGWYFVAVRSTPNGGVIASVVNAANITGRSGIHVLSYPPLTVSTFDGGAPVVYEYSTFADAPTSAIAAANRPGQLPAANQTVMRSTDAGRSWVLVSTPSTDGTLGFAGPLEWWWIGPDEVATSHDGGLSWSPVRIVDLSQPITGSLVLLDGTHAWMSGVAKGVPVLYRTDDGGERWTPVSLPALNL